MEIKKVFIGLVYLLTGVLSLSSCRQDVLDDISWQADGEKIYFVIKSKSDEYVFTNRGLLHVDGTSAVSKKRVVKRHDFYYEKVHSVTLETAGTIDLDIEIKFSFGNDSFSIDVDKKQLEQLKDLYKATPVYETFPGWTENISKATKFEELPKNAQNFVKFIENYLKIKFVIISVGPDQKETIQVEDIF